MMKEKRSVSIANMLWLMMGLLLCSIVIALRITFSPILLSISSSSSSTTLSLPSESHSISSPQPPPPLPAPTPPENAHSKIGKRVKRGPPESPVLSRISCDRSPSRYDLCTIDGPTVVDPTTATFFALGPTGSTRPNTVEKIQLYPRKFEDYIMAKIKNVTLISGPKRPPCKVHHNVTALVFSAGGYTGNFFHDFNDGFIPLFITVNTLLRDDEEFAIVITEGPDWWSSKYKDLLQVFTKHPIISLKNDNATHCFPSAHLGLIAHGFMTINQTLLPNSKTYIHFHDFLHKAYGRGHHGKTSMFNRPDGFRPRLVLVSRKGSAGRLIINRRKVIKVMKQVGFDVVVFEPTSNTSLHESYALISSSHVMIGVHGAALTHSLFLRPGAVFMQIVPIGVEWAAGAFFGRVGREMNLEYIEYRIGVGESSLVDKYGKNSMLLKDPFGMQKKGWPTEIMDIYLKKQNVRLDLIRFKKCLKEAYTKAEKFMRQGQGEENSLVPEKKLH